MRRKLDYSQYFQPNKKYEVETDKGIFRGFYNSMSSTHEKVSLVADDGTGQHVISSEDITKVHEVEN